MSKELVFVPYWIHESLRRKALSISTVLDYSKIREHFSLTDCAGLLSLQEDNGIVPFSNKHWFGHLLSSWGKSATSAQVLELDSTIRPLSHGDDIKGELLTRLEPTDDEEIPPYELVNIERGCAYLVVYPGFVKAMQHSEERLELTRKVLKVFYVHNKVQDVSRSEMFSDYVTMLENKIWSNI